MKKNKYPLAGRLFCLALGALCVLRAAGYVREIHGGRESIARCRKTLDGGRSLPPGYLSQLEDRVAELRALETAEGTSQSAAQASSEDPAGRIRNALRAHAVGVERFRTLSTGGGAAGEFVLSGAPVNFLRFLQGAADLPLPLNYISIKPNARLSTIDATVRFNYAR
jgi:hypothetical protein